MSLASYSSDDGYTSSEGVHTLSSGGRTTPPPLHSSSHHHMRPGASSSGLAKTSSNCQGFRQASGGGAAGISGLAGPGPIASSAGADATAGRVAEITSCPLQHEGCAEAGDGHEGASMMMQASMSDCSQLNSAHSGGGGGDGDDALMLHPHAAAAAAGAGGRPSSGALVAPTWPPSRVTSPPPLMLGLQQQQQQQHTVEGTAQLPPLAPRRSVPGLPPLWAAPTSQQQLGADGGGGVPMDAGGLGHPPGHPPAVARPLASRRMSESLFRSLSAGLMVPPSSMAGSGGAGAGGLASPGTGPGGKPRTTTQRTPTNSQPQVRLLLLLRPLLHLRRPPRHIVTRARAARTDPGAHASEP